MKSTEKVWNFIAAKRAANKKNPDKIELVHPSKIEIVPFEVTRRNWGEDHIVLLLVQGADYIIIDPKFGWNLGDAVAKSRIYGLGWQGLLDTKSCGRLLGK